MSQVPMALPTPPTGSEVSSSDAATATASTAPSAAGTMSATPAPPNAPMGPPPPRNPTPITISAEKDSTVGTEHVNAPSAEETQPKRAVENHPDKDGERDSNSVGVAPRSKVSAAPYSIPPWSEHPGHPFYVEVLKEGAIVERLDVLSKRVVQVLERKFKHWLWSGCYEESKGIALSTLDKVFQPLQLDILNFLVSVPWKHLMRLCKW